MKKLFALLLIVVLFVTPVSVFAADPFKDVTKSTVDDNSYSAIAYVKSHKGWTGIAVGGKLQPNRFVTRREVIRLLYNLYGKKNVPVSIWDTIYANQSCTSKLVINRFVAVSNKLGYPIKWTGNSTKMRRKDVARYAKIFGTYHKKLAPKH